MSYERYGSLMWWADSKGAENQSASKVQNRQTEKKKKNKPSPFYDSERPGPSNKATSVISPESESACPLYNVYRTSS